MTDPALIERITRSLAFMLRHQPETFDLELDPHGFAELDDVVHALNERLGEPVEEEDVREAVGSGDRPRYEIQGTRIRALYGHSIPVEPGPSAKPPEFLFVAVPEQELERARRFGLRGGRRRFLHLALTKDDAAESGRRASRDYAVLVIHALDAWEEGISFYDRTALWLAEEIPTHLIEVEGSYHDGTDPLPRRFDGPRERGGYERERSHESHGHGHGGHGRGRGRGGRGRDRHQGRGGPERHEERAGARDGDRSPSFAGPGGQERGGRGPGGRPERDGARNEGNRAPEPRESHSQPVYAAERTPDRPEGRFEGRRGGRRDERPDERRERAPERREPSREERSEPRRESRESAPEPRRTPPPAAPPRGGGGGGGFGAGLEGEEQRRERPQRVAPQPSAPPPRKEPPPAVRNDGPGFGAGL